MDLKTARTIGVVGAILFDLFRIAVAIGLCLFLYINLGLWPFVACAVSIVGVIGVSRVASVLPVVFLFGAFFAMCYEVFKFLLN